MQELQSLDVRQILALPKECPCLFGQLPHLQYTFFGRARHIPVVFCIGRRTVEDDVLSVDGIHLALLDEDVT
jgi:hypothetical protein